MAGPPRRWGKLDIDKVTEIVKRVRCEIDRASMAAASQTWLQAVERAKGPPSLPRLPSLLLEPAGGTGVYCYLSGCRDHGRFPGPRHFGSYDGAWLFLAYGQTRGHRLFNIRTGASRALHDWILGEYDDGNRIPNDIVILAATLSCPPDEPDSVAAGIVIYQPRLDLGAPRRRGFAFWRPGHEVAHCKVMPAVGLSEGLELEDVVHYRPSFHFITRGGHILRCTCTLDGNWDIQLKPLKLFRFRADGTNEKFVRARYLVESRGKLLMVVRLARAPHHHEATSSFKVFKPSPDLPGPVVDDGEEEEQQADEDPRAWIELATLDGRMLFVGRGCSTSYEVSEYPGFKDGIFFLDDWSFYDHEMMFRGVHERQYPCNDIGRWSPEGPEGSPSHVDLYFPERVPSCNSPPAWLLP